MNPPCAYCSGPSQIAHKGLRHPVWREMVDITMYRCAQCGSLTTYPMPTHEHLSACYGKYSVDGYPANKSKAKKESNQRVWYADVLRQFSFPADTGVAVADIGAGEGLLEETMRSAGHRGQISCFDFHAMPERIRRLNSTGTAPEVCWRQVDFSRRNWVPREQYDWVFCLSVIEHVTDPGQLVRDLVALCRRGGKVCIIGPCVDTMWYRLLRTRWVYMIPGEHLSMPSIAGIRGLMRGIEVQQVGVRTIPVTYSLKYMLDGLFKISTPQFLDFVLRLRVGAFALEVTK